MKRKVSEQAQDLNRLVRMTSSELSSASASEAATPDRVPNFSFAVPRGTARSHETSPTTSQTPPYSLTKADKKDETPVS